MQINFTNLHIENFMSIETADVQLNKNGYIMVSGKNINPDDNAKSNGSGKSTIFESIVWCLTGETIRGAKNVKRFNSEGVCSVAVSCLIDNVNYKIIRTKDPANLKIFIADEDKSGKGIRDSQKLLEEYLPDLTAQLIGSVIIMGQGLPMRFSSNSPSGRKDVLEKLSRSDFMIEDLKSKVSSRKNELTTSKSSYESEIKVTEALINSKQNLVTSSQAELTALDQVNYDSELKLLNDQSTSINAKLIDENSKLEKVTTNISDISIQQSTTSTEKFNKFTENKEVYAKKSCPINDKLVEYKSKAAVLRNEINRIQSIKQVCPTCGQKLQGVEKPDPAPIQAELEEVDAKIAELNTQLQDINKQLIDKQAEITAQYSAIDLSYSQKLQDIKREQQLITSAIRDLNTNLQAVSQRINSLTILKNNLQFKKDQLTKTISDATTSISDLTAKLTKLNSELESDKIHLDIIIKFENALKRDFRGILLNNVINYIDSKAKEYSQAVFGTTKLDFKLDGNNISISYCGKEYENLSGGERAKIDVIIQFALRDMLCKYLNFSSNILVLDEIVDNLDSVGCQEVMNLISTKLNDVSGIYIISHHAEIPMPIDYEIVVTKDEGGISHVDDRVL